MHSNALDLRLPQTLSPPRRPSSRLKLLAVALDLAAIIGAVVVAAVVRQVSSGDAAEIARGPHPLLVVASLPIWIAIFVNFKLYSARYLVRGVEEFRRLVRACAAGVVGIAVLSYAFTQDVGRGLLVAVFFLSVLFTGSERLLVRRTLTHQRRAGNLLRPVLIAGTNVEALSLCSMLSTEAWHGYRVVGLLGEDPGEEASLEPPVLGPVGDAVAIASRTGVSGVLIATTSVGFAEVNRLTRDLTDAGFYVEVSSALHDIAPERLLVRPLGSFPFYYVEPVKRHGWRPIAKRVSDIALAAAGLVLLIPLFMVLSLLIKVNSPGSVYFCQERVGKDGRLFRLYKFRTMVPGAEQRVIELRAYNEASGPLFKLRKDPRVTRVGRFLRRWSLDELPQLFNVLRGEMSLVGPRPALPSEVAGWNVEAHGRLRVRPGLSGMWQVLGRRNSSFEEYIRLDLYYVDNWSLLTDLGILAKTVPTVLFGRGSY